MISALDRWLCLFINRISIHVKRIVNVNFNSQLGKCGKGTSVRNPNYCLVPKKIFLGNNVNVNDGLTFIARPDCEAGKLIIKDNAIITQNFTAITNNHSVVKELGKTMKEVTLSRRNDKDEDIVIEEDVWVACNVTILPGVTVGRGAIIGAGAVLRRSIPPYAIVLGNPGMVIGYRFTPDEIIEHERILYPEDFRIPKDILVKKYNEFIESKKH